MMQRDDFEHRLGQGLKRWAKAGEPTLDLEALVNQRLNQPGDAAPEQPGDKTPQPAVVPLQPRKRRWTRWLTAAAAAAALMLSVGATFPAWAGAAAGWPLVGPVVTEIIMKDAGLKWAYDNGLINGTLAEVKEGEIAVRILGVMADARRTTVIYQVTGLPPSKPALLKPIRAGEMGHHPPQSKVDLSISKVNGQGGFSSSVPPTETPLGLFGTVSTLPLETDSAELEIGVRIGDQRLKLTVPASRAETDRFSRKVLVGQAQEIDGVKVTVESVIFTPAETIVAYQIDSPRYNGSIQWDPETDLHYLDVDGKRYKVTGGGSGINHRFIEAYPPIQGKSIKFVVPVKVKGVAIDATWPLTEGAVSEVLGVPVTLTGYQRQGREVSFQWESPDQASFYGIAGFEAIDQNGQAHQLGKGWSGESNYVHDGIRMRRYSTELPEGVEPVAIRARRAAVAVRGPWVFELPR